MNQAVAASANAVREISIFDTTLRDGEQAPRNGMTVQHKADLAVRLEALGVDIVEVGFPAASPVDFQAARLAAAALRTARIATLSRTTKADVKTAVDAAGVDRHQIQLLATASELHLEHKRGIAPGEAIREVSEATRFAASLGIQDISVGLEDASRGSARLLRGLVEAGLEAGATTFVLGDTSGCMVPEEYGELVSTVRGWLPGGMTLATHCHDDMGLSLANALAGVAAGADQVQTTLAGVGERSGNTALEELAAVLVYKGDRLGAVTRIRTRAIYEAYLQLKDTMRIGDIRNKAIVGSNAFSTAAGIHQLGVLQKPETYEYLDPADFGRERSVLVSRHSGKAVLRYLAQEQGFELGPEAISELYDEMIGSRTDTEVETLSELGVRVAKWIEAEPERAGTPKR